MLLLPLTTATVLFICLVYAVWSTWCQWLPADVQQMAPVPVVVLSGLTNISVWKFGELPNLPNEGPLVVSISGYLGLEVAAVRPVEGRAECFSTQGRRNQRVSCSVEAVPQPAWHAAGSVGT